MGLNTGGSTSTTTTAPGNTSGQQLQQNQIGSAFNAAGGLGTFAAPSNLYNLTPGENLFTGLGMLNSLPGAQASRALSYVAPGTPAGNMFQKYFQDFTAPTLSNNLLKSGYVGQSGANTQALANAGQTAAMQGLTSFGMPMAQADMANIGQGLGYAGLQRQTQIQDLARVQNLLQTLAGLLPSTVPGGTQTTSNQGPGLSASLLNLGGGILGAAAPSLLSGLGSLGSSLFSGIGSLFSGSPSSSLDSLGTGSNPYATTAPDAVLTDSGIDPNALAEMQMWDAGGAFGAM